MKARVTAHPPSKIEQMWISLNMQGTRLAIGTAYRPEWVNVDEFIDSLTDSVASFSRFDNIVILGDFNINLLDVTDVSSIKLNNFLFYSQLKQIINVPTHFYNDNTETLIDVVITNARTREVTVKLTKELSKHAFIGVVLDLRTEKRKPLCMMSRNLVRINMDDFNNHLVSIPWENVLKLYSVDDMVKLFNHHIIQLFDTHAPIKKNLVKQRKLPWLTDTVLIMMRLRDEAHQKFRTTKLKQHKEYYKSLKHLVEHSLIKEKCAYYEHHVNTRFKDPKSMWKTIKHTVEYKKRCEELPDHFNDAEAINTHFLNVPGDGVVSLSDLTFYELHRFSTSTFSLRTVGEEMVEKILLSIDTKAQGVDGLTVDMVLLTIPRTLKVITTIINRSLETGVFPESWKVAMVGPLPKIPHPMQIKDLRAISILPILSKVLEKIVHSQLSSFLENIKALPSVQSGFRKGLSTCTALADVVDNVVAARDKGMCTALVLLDYSRAFDCINIPLLLSKLTFYGVDRSAVKWFDSYLCNRKQLVKIRKIDGSHIHSEPKLLTRGVPQGSILGPLLFILYTANITQVIKKCSYHIYADDLQVYFAFRPEDSISAANTINTDLNAIAEWSRRSGLVLNSDKTKYILLGTDMQISKTLIQNPKIMIENTEIERVSEAKNLGMEMDGSLKFEKHVINIVRNCFYRLKLLYKIRRYISVEVRVHLCEALILSKLNYGDAVFGGCLLARSERLIQRVQNACTRFCYNVPPRTHITPFLNDAKQLKMAARRELHFAVMLFGIIKNKQPEYLYDKLKWSSAVNKYDTRASAHLLIIPKHQSAGYKASFCYRASKIWNDLPPPIRECKSKATFSLKLKKYLLDLQKLSP